MMVVDHLTDEEALQDAREGLNLLRLEMNGNLSAQLAIFQINELLNLFEKRVLQGPKKPRGWQHAWGLFDKRAKPVDQKK